jgi:hypothetical protein
MNRPHPVHRIFGLLAALAGVAVVPLVAAPSFGRGLLTQFDALPRPTELLAQPVWVPHCAMYVVEWRSSPAFLTETSITDEAVAVIDSTCQYVFARYPEFLQTKGLVPGRHVPDRLPSLSLLPGNVLLDGRTLRALNDLTSRFQAVAPGCCYWGLYVHSIHHVFLRNDPLIRSGAGTLAPNPRFVRTLTHELSHVLSWHLGVWDVVPFDRIRDEELADDFVAYTGLSCPVESSSEDLDFRMGLVSPPLDRSDPQNSPSANTP